MTVVLWLMSCSLRVIHIVPLGCVVRSHCIRASFLLMAESYSVVCIDHILLIHSSGLFLPFAVVKNAVTIIGVRLSESQLSVLWGTY